MTRQILGISKTAKEASVSRLMAGRFLDRHVVDGVAMPLGEKQPLNYRHVVGVLQRPLVAG